MPRGTAIGVGVGLAIVMFALGRATSGHSAAVGTSAARGGAVALGEQRTPGSAPQESLAELDTTSADSTVHSEVADAGAPSPATGLLSNLLHNVDVEARRDPDAPIERIANSVQADAGGVVLVALAYPAVARDLRAEVHARLCSGNTSDAGRIVLLRMMLGAPPLVDSTSIDCTLRREETESLVLWTALQVYQRAGLRPTSETERWLRSARDERTLRLLGESRRPVFHRVQAPGEQER